MSDKTINIRKGLFLYRQKGSPFWYARIKTDMGWVSKTTKTTNQHEAGAIAIGFMEQPQPKKGTTHTFGYYATIYMETLRTNWKPIYASYISSLKKWILPFFDKMPLNTITEDTIQHFETWRDKHTPLLSRGTINQHNIVIRGVFETAFRKRAITRGKIPVLTTKGKGKQLKSRPAFTVEEYLYLCRKMRYYHKTKQKFSSAYRAQILRHYVLFIANCGARPGKEVDNLKWKHITEFVDISTKNTYLQIQITQGKRGKRIAIGRNVLRHYLERLKTITNRTDPEDYLFCYPDGKPVRDLQHDFKQMLIEFNLLRNNMGEERTLYSLRHTFITFRIIYGKVPLIVLSRQCGVSVAVLDKTYAHLEPLQAAEILSK